MHNYCKTCHSFQGSTIEEDFPIFDHKFAYVTRKWFYTAVTKATDLKNVFFDEGKENEREMIQYFLLGRWRNTGSKTRRPTGPSTTPAS